MCMKAWAVIRRAVLRRDGFRCVQCGWGEPGGIGLEVDHIVPQARGGGHDPSNLRTLCVPCHREVSKVFVGVVAADMRAAGSKPVPGHPGVVG